MTKLSGRSVQITSLVSDTYLYGFVDVVELAVMPLGILGRTTML